MKILYFAAVRDWIGRDEESIHIGDPVTISELADTLLGTRLGGRKPANLLFALNEEFVGMDRKVTDADTLAVLPPLSGGSV